MVLKLMVGLLTPVSGDRRIGDRPIFQIDLRAWRRSVGTVMQDDLLFNGSIAENICFFDPRPDAQAIEASARNVGFHDQIVAMPMGYRTRVGDMGSTLSGGQRQRLLMARASGHPAAARAAERPAPNAHQSRLQRGAAPTGSRGLRLFLLRMTCAAFTFR
jgi:ABC-type bacteriocin/lantibiotic exporter with double-glycine peptidase domain